MTLEDSGTIDLVAFDPKGGVSLVIVDDLTWEDVNRHMFLIQEKVNAYCAFIQSGELAHKPTPRVDQSLLS